MAIKAGLVGVNPKGVDKNGMPIGSGGGGDSYTKTESDSRYYTKLAVDNLLGSKVGIGQLEEDYYTKLSVDQMLGSKVGIGQLEANNKSFHFAYDNTTEKYGYKLDGTGDFIPFESAGGGPGWVKPANLITTGLTVNKFEIISGGYYKYSGIIYVDMILKKANDNNVGYISGLTTIGIGSGDNMLYQSGKNTVEEAEIYTGYSTLSVQTNTNIPCNANKYAHIFGEFIDTTT